MDLRMLELMTPARTAKEAREVIEGEEVLGIWNHNLDDGGSILRVLIDVDNTETLSDKLSKKFSKVEGFRIMLFSVEATMPPPPVIKEDESSDIDRISREELYADVISGSKLNWIYVITNFLSTIVAAFGLLNNDVTIIIGAMVISPLLGPNVAMALAATLGDKSLGLQALKANGVGLLIALAVSYILGSFFSIDPEFSYITIQTSVDMADISIALAAGSAGALAFTRGVPSSVIGVMVAIALLPALVSTGLLLGAGHLYLGISTAVLAITNLVCINLAGILTFLIQGVRPRVWRQAEEAQKATRAAIVIWFVLLVILGALILFWSKI